MNDSPLPLMTPGTVVRSSSFDWFKPSEGWPEGRYDVALGADILYDKRFPPAGNSTHSGGGDGCYNSDNSSKAFEINAHFLKCLRHPPYASSFQVHRLIIAY